MKKVVLLLLIFAMVSGLLAIPPSRKYLVRTFKDKNGNWIDEYRVPGFPPDKLMPAVIIPPNSKSVVTLSNVPAFDWCYGCSATSAAMMAGYYDNGIFPNMYTGPTNGGVVPMNNSSWGSGECPLSATHQGYDGLTSKGHVDDYYDSYNSTVDPYYGNWTEHPNADCTADYMGTNQYHHYGNTDGSTTFYYYSDGKRLYDYTGCEPSGKDGCHGLREFIESRGYAVQYSGGNYQNYSQYIYGYNGNTQGFTYAQYKAEIDAGRPVLIQLDGHTMLGFGYDDTSGNTVYIHDTWDHSDHTMTWGGSYGGKQHIAVTCAVLVDPSITVTSPNGGENWLVGSTYNITWNSQYVTNVDIRLYQGATFVGTIVSGYSASAGSYSWTIPAGTSSGSNYYIKISDTDAPSDYDDSDAYFTISNPTITVTTPNGGENWTIGSNYNITWTSSGAGSYVKIDLYSNGSFYKNITSSTNNNGSYNWTIPSNYLAGNQYKIRIEDTSLSSTYDLSDTDFTLSNPPGHGTSDNSADNTQPVSVDVEPVTIGSNTVDPNTVVDPTTPTTLEVVVDVTDSAQHSVPDPGSVSISYSINITGDVSSNTLTFDLEYTGLSYNGSHPAYIDWWDTATSQWKSVPNPQWNTPTNEHVTFDLTLENTKDGVTEIIMGDNNPLPVVMSSFTSAYINGNALLMWVTESESNSSYWNVYRSFSSNQAQSEKINNSPIPAMGNSTVEHKYIFTDPANLEPGTYHYWLESVSVSGESQMYGSIALVIEDNDQPNAPSSNLKYGIIANLPNPFNPSTIIKFRLKKSGNAKLVIYDLKGEKVSTLFSGYVEKDKEISKVWNAENLPSGVYLYKLITKDKTYHKKMLLMK